MNIKNKTYLTTLVTMTFVKNLWNLVNCLNLNREKTYFISVTNSYKITVEEYAIGGSINSKICTENSLHK